MFFFSLLVLSQRLISISSTDETSTAPAVSSTTAATEDVSRVLPSWSWTVELLPTERVSSAGDEAKSSIASFPRCGPAVRTTHPSH